MKTNEIVTVVTSVLECIALLFASWRAYRYFDPFDIKKRQHKLVMDLLVALTNQQIVLSCSNIKKEKGYSITIIDKLNTQNIENFLDRKNGRLKEINIFETPIKFELNNFIWFYGKISQIDNYIYLPKTIADRLNVLNFYSFEGLGDLNPEHRARIHFAGNPNNNPKIISEFAVEKEGFVMLFDYLKRYHELISSCVKWLKSEKYYSKDLNI